MARATAELILIPSPAMGHVAGMLEFAKLLIKRSEQLYITVVIIKLPDYIDSVSGTFVDAVIASAGETRLRFVHLPSTDPSPEWSSRTRGHFVYRLVQSQRNNLRDFLSESPGIVGVVVDMVVTPFMEVAGDFGIPAYVFFTSGVAFLGLMIHFQIVQDEEGEDVTEFANSLTELSFPSYDNSVPASVLPTVLVDKETWLGRFVGFARDLRKAKDKHALRRVKLGLADELARRPAAGIRRVRLLREPGEPTGESSESRGRLRIALRMELDSGKHMVRSADSDLAVALRAAGERFPDGERVGDGRGNKLGLLREKR
nr:anthocyanidin 3-O-glucosyltransferase 2-like [Ipomoea batatas]